MDITFSSFKEKLPFIQEAITSCSFLSVDGEFTGLNQSWNLNAYDSPADRYAKQRQNAEDFLLVQFGLCTFHYDSEENKYSHQAFNFYIFPREYKGITPDRRFYCQASSLDFLVKQGFDFNKLLKEGIPYVRASDEDTLRTALAERQAQRVEDRKALENESNQDGTVQTACAVPDDHKDFIENVHSQVKQFLEGEAKTLELSPCSAYRRKLIFETVRSTFSNLDMETIRTDKGYPYIQVTKASKDELKKRASNKIEAEKEQLEEAIGFTKVIQMITDSGKPVVGHNMFLDVLHIVSQFLCQLPEDYDEFKEVMKGGLPRVLDTKLMVSINPFKEHFQETGLSNILKRLDEKPFSLPVVGPRDNCPGYTTEKEQLHEAGYDAYITGLCFISLAQYLNSQQKKKKHKTKCDWGSSPLIQPFINKIFMMLSPDIPYLNLAGYELQPSRAHVFYTTFPKEWRQQNLYELFTSIGPVSVCWINDTSAFIALKYPEKAPGAKAFLKNTRDVWRVYPYDYYHQLKKQTPDLQSPIAKTDVVTKRKKSSSGPSEDVNQSSPEDASNRNTAELSDRKRSKIFEEPSNWE